MPQSLSKIILHIIFSTKNRAPLIPKHLLGEMHSYVASICRNQGCEAFRVGGTQNHIHIACLLSRTIAVSQLVEEIKKSSSKWVKKRDKIISEFSWQGGYGVFSVGQSHLDTLIQYIDGQEVHHSQRDFKDELLELLRRYGVRYDLEHLWN